MIYQIHDLPFITATVSYPCQMLHVSTFLYKPFVVCVLVLFFGRLKIIFSLTEVKTLAILYLHHCHFFLFKGGSGEVSITAEGKVNIAVVNFHVNYIIIESDFT